jgi:hypothetical protein
MNVEIGAEAALFPEKDYIQGIFVAGGVIAKFATTPPTIRLLSKIPRGV